MPFSYLGRQRSSHVTNNIVLVFYVVLAASWHSQRFTMPRPTPSRFSEMQSLIEDELYSKSKIKTLEDYLQQQVTEETYDFEANKALIKHYIIFPDKTDQDKVVTLLLKALLNLPATDFTLLLYLIPEKLQADPTIQNVKKAAVALDTARYSEFWSIVKETAAFETIPNWHNEIRKYIMSVHAAAYQTVAVSILATAVGLSGIQLEAFLSAQDSIAKMEGEHVHIALNPENQPRPQRKFKGSMELSSMTSVLKKLAA